MPHDEISNFDDDTKLSSDFFHGDIATGLESMRKRLLDLSNSNRLLNFKHPKGSALRVVDEIPNFLYERLIDGSELSFRPVPKPRHNDLLWNTELPKDIDATEFAKIKGIDTSYELAVRDLQDRSELPRNLIDNEIQTLHYPEKLEALVGRISNNARLAIEETGTNMLYLVFGFLEWFEDDNSESPHLAPLFLLPASLRRGNPDPSSHTYKYFLSYSGEDIITNISLQEKMKSEFSLKIPDIENEQTPEDYLSKFSQIISGFERWKIRRFVTLTLLSFGKLLMYRDLDPELWPKEAQISNHPRVTEFFEGIQAETITHAAEYDLDELQPPEEPPLLIDNADSSQHSAIIDALKGKNLVIEGPPGTGKSQTITNLIAAALTEGKSILFVSEKLAALEVVRRRLEKCGLGSFCLELHSNKTKKQELLRDVEKRIDLQLSFRDIDTLENKLQLLNSQRQLLHQYAKRISQPFGAVNIPIFDLIWRRQRLLTKINISEDSLKHFLILDAPQLNQLTVDQRLQDVGLFATHLSQVLAVSKKNGGENISFHPFWGIRNGRLSFFEQQSFIDVTRQIIAEGARLKELEDSLTALISDGRSAENLKLFETSFTGVSNFVAGVASLDSVRGTVCAEIFDELKRPGVKQRLHALIKNIGDFRKLQEEIISLTGHATALCRQDIDLGAEQIHQIAKIISGQTTVRELQELSDQIRGHLDSIDNSAVALREFTNLTNIEIANDRIGLELVHKTIEILERAPFEQLHIRHEGFKGPTAVSILDQAHRVALFIKSIRAEFESKFNMGLVPDKSLLNEQLAICANAGWLRFLRADYRNVKKSYRTFSRSSVRVGKEALRKDLESLWDFRSRIEKFDFNEDFRVVSGSHFKGVDSDFEALLSVALWFKSIENGIGGAFPTGSEMVDSIWTLEANKIRQFQSNRLENLKGTIHSGVKSLESCAKLLPNTLNGRAVTLEEITGILKAFIQATDVLLTIFQKNQLPKLLSLLEVSELLDKCGKAIAIEAMILSDDECRSLLGEHFSGASTDISVLLNTLYCFESIEQSSLTPYVKDWLQSRNVIERLNALRSAASSLKELINDLKIKHEELVTLGNIDLFHWYQSYRDFEDIDLDTILRRSNESIKNSTYLSEWILYLAARQAMGTENSVKRLASDAEEGKIKPSHLPDLFQLAFYNSLLDEAFADSPQLQQFSGLSHERLRDAFAKLDRDILLLFQKRAAYTISRRYVPIGNGRGPVGTYTDRSLLMREIRKQKRHIPIRQLVNRAGNALQALKPCFMMGPLSVAQYLPPGQFEFDYVVMDEASQLKPEDALGAIARGKQLVIVGDRKQLPPTSFFDRIGDDEEEDADDNIAQALQDAESILDVASAVYQPSRMLRWHYRSRHASLIAFSNQEFYHQRLIVFPSPESKAAELGVKFIHIDDGIYSARHNVKEAEVLVESIFNHIETNPNQSLGVVSLNSVQRDLIDDLFKQKLKERPSAEVYLSEMKNKSEPFFIKNLENVQGDERDIIFVSITYGPDEKGHVFQRFGPINSVTGHRRLNVLFTRSRFRLDVFSSMTHDQVHVSEDSKAGVKALKKYLEFAQTGILETAQFTGREPDSDFEVEVASALRDRGYGVVAQVGVAGFYIDLAVKHPSISDKFVLGIECDGATYHSSRSARDRDRLREEILNGLGWNLHRIWSTDWFRNSDNEVNRLVQKLELATMS